MSDDVVFCKNLVKLLSEKYAVLKNEDDFQMVLFYSAAVNVPPYNAEHVLDLSQYKGQVDYLISFVKKSKFVSNLGYKVKIKVKAKKKEIPVGKTEEEKNYRAQLEADLKEHLDELLKMK